MSLTLRQVQKMFSASCKGGVNSIVRVPRQADRHTLGALAQHLGHERFTQAVVKSGFLHNPCDCSSCTGYGRECHTARPAVDRWVRKYGPNADLRQVLDAETSEKKQQQAGRGSGQESGQQQPQSNQQSQAQQAGQQSGGQGQSEAGNNAEQAQTTGPAPEPHPATAPFSEPPRVQQPTPADKAKAKQLAARDKIAAAKRALAAMRKNRRSATRAQVYSAKRQLREARKQASFNKVAMASAPSLEARRQVAKANGRLRRVQPAIRSKMADLINRLVMRGGTAGDSPSPTPLLSAQKVVKRFLVRRPLSNAFKEDTITGRPVTVFLPDVSPSCEHQAQIACDLANAAGFAGVSGSDVLVFPHSNGCVEADASYVPWFNGKPMLTEIGQITSLFNAICAGNSRFRVRVAVLLGDHDAVDRYGEIAALRSVLRVIWLHNYGDPDGRSGLPPVMAEKTLLPAWSPEAMKKLTMVSGCGGQKTMLQGFELALRC